jgi:uncharacterized protein (DUF924 family)
MMTPETVLTFWFGDDPTVRRKAWFEKNSAFDVQCASFTDVLRDAKTGIYDHWTATPLGALALLILLDQLSRNLHRGSPEAFAADTKARAVARAAITQGFDQQLTPVQRMFIYLPFEHSEVLADQDESVRLFETLRDTLGADTIDYAHRHRDVIRRFGRFPHRNAAMGRANTAEEDTYLAEPGAGF